MKKLDIVNIADRTQYYSSELKKMICEKQKCGKYQPCRFLLKILWQYKITISSVKTQAAIFRDKFGLSKRLLGLEFKSNHSIKSKCLKWIVKIILPNYQNE